VEVSIDLFLQQIYIKTIKKPSVKDRGHEEKYCWTLYSFLWRDLSLHVTLILWTYGTLFFPWLIAWLIAWWHQLCLWNCYVTYNLFVSNRLRNKYIFDRSKPYILHLTIIIIRMMWITVVALFQDPCIVLLVYNRLYELTKYDKGKILLLYRSILNLGISYVGNSRNRQNSVIVIPPNKCSNNYPWIVYVLHLVIGLGIRSIELLN
jgi:hypothetical protein